LAPTLGLPYLHVNRAYIFKILSYTYTFQFMEMMTWMKMTMIEMSLRKFRRRREEAREGVEGTI
jgi:hypothetical protein